MRTKQAALQLADEVTLAATELEPIVVTLDAEEAASALSSDSRLAILITAPRLEFATWTALDATFELHVIAGEPGNMLAAWDLLDDALEVLVPHLNPDEVNPASFANPAGPPWPALTLTLTRPHDF